MIGMEQGHNRIGTITDPDPLPPVLSGFLVFSQVFQFSDLGCAHANAHAHAPTRPQCTQTYIAGSKVHVKYHAHAHALAHAQVYAYA
jgi:hypothetical protein